MARLSGISVRLRLQMSSVQLGWAVGPNLLQPRRTRRAGLSKIEGLKRGGLRENRCSHVASWPR